MFEIDSDRLRAVYKCLQDDESRANFMSRVNYFYTHDIRHLHDMVESAVLFGRERIRKFDSIIPTLDSFIRDPNYRKKDIVLYGASWTLDQAYPILERFNLKIRAICDGDASKQGSVRYGFTVISPDVLMRDYKNCHIIVTGFFGTLEYYFGDLYVYGRNNIIDFLLDNGFPHDRIIVLTDFGEVYFGPEFIMPVEDEYYIDVGLMNLFTIKQFIRFCEMGAMSYKKILAFEPDKLCYDRCVEAVKEGGFENIDIINKGAYSSKGTLCFNANGSGQGLGRIDENGSTIIETVTIDEIVGDDKVTFIKMDIEGAEYEALKGAAETIRRNKPRLAISIYHKAEDVIDILLYINRLVPEYRFWIRQYSYFMGETVLYCVI